MILAGIDIGTNTLRLLIAEVGQDGLREIYSDRRITRLGQDLERSGVIAPEAEERSLSILAEFGEKINRHFSSHTSAVGTSALRKASNSDSLIQKAKKEAKIDIRVISGEEEARLTLLGVAGALRAKTGKVQTLDLALVVDIGGGSTEVVVTKRGGTREEISLHLGAVYLTERFIRHDPPADTELAALRRAVRHEVVSVDRIAGPPTVEMACMGTAGTITTLAAMDQGLVEYDPERINGYVLTRDSLDGIVQTLSNTAIADRKKIAGLEPGREDIILAGAIVTQEIMGRYGFTKMLVSDWGLREGIVLDLYERLSAAGNK